MWKPTEDEAIEVGDESNEAFETILHPITVMTRKEEIPWTKDRYVDKVKKIMIMWPRHVNYKISVYLNYRMAPE